MEQKTMKYKVAEDSLLGLSQSRFVISSSTLIDWSMTVFFSASFFRLIFSKILGGFQTEGLVLAVVDFFIYIPLFFGLLLEIRSRKKPSFIFLAVLAIVWFYFEVTLALNPGYEYWFDRDIYGIWDTVFRFDKGGIYGFLFFSLIKDSKRLYKNFKYIAIFNYIVLIYQYLQYLSNGYWTQISYTGEYVEASYSLDYGYDAVFVFILFIAFYFIERKKIFIFIAIPSLLLVILFGSRGPFVVIAAFFLIYVIRFILKADFKRKWIYLLLILSGTLVLYFSFDYILTGLLNLLSDMDLSSRTVQALLDNTLFDDSGRSVINELARDAIEDAPFWGYGAYGDRHILGPYYVWGYCHNILLELQVDFGKIPGLVILVLIVIFTIQRFYQADDNRQFIVILCIFSMCMRLLLSGTFWEDAFFWALLAIIICWREHKFKFAARV